MFKNLTLNIKSECSHQEMITEFLPPFLQAKSSYDAPVDFLVLLRSKKRRKQGVEYELERQRLFQQQTKSKNVGFESWICTGLGRLRRDHGDPTAAQDQRGSHHQVLGRPGSHHSPRTRQRMAVQKCQKGRGPADQSFDPD